MCGVTIVQDLGQAGRAEVSYVGVDANYYPNGVYIMGVAH